MFDVSCEILKSSSSSDLSANLTSDLRDPTTTPLNFTRSINLALSERGVTAMKASNIAGLAEKVMEETIPMRARMIHGRDIKGELYEQSQQYDIDNKVSAFILHPPDFKYSQITGNSCCRSRRAQQDSPRPS